jgi:hypothetical protein
MRWAEFIMLRTAGNAGQDVYKFLDQIVASVNQPGLIDAALYNHAAISGDIALVFLWDTEEPISWGSDIALGLINELKRLGLVDHSVWTRIGEQTPKDNGR